MSFEFTLDSLLAPPPARGRKSPPLQIAYVRDLTEADVGALWDVPEGGLQSTTPPLKRIRHSHHMMARLLAQGTPAGEVSLITGFHPSRISVLQKDPAVKELIEYYKSQLNEVFLDVHQRLARLGLDSIDELQARLEEDPDEFSFNQLKELAELCLDRGGFGPQTNHNHSGAVALVSSDTVAKIKQALEQRQRSTVVPLRAPDSDRVIDGELLLPSPSPSEGEEG